MNVFLIQFIVNIKLLLLDSKLCCVFVKKKQPKNNIVSETDGFTHQAGGKGGVWLAKVERTHANQVGDIRGWLPCCLCLLGVGGQQKVLPCTATQWGSSLNTVGTFSSWRCGKLTTIIYKDNQVFLWIWISLKKRHNIRALVASCWEIHVLKITKVVNKWKKSWWHGYAAVFTVWLDAKAQTFYRKNSCFSLHRETWLLFTNWNRCKWKSNNQK